MQVSPPNSPRIRTFSRFAVADWSGAKGASHPGIALAVCSTGLEAPQLILPPGGRAWSRTAVLDWVLAQDDDLLIGFDFSFAPPFVARGSYFPGEQVPDRARALWAHVEQHCDDTDFGAASLLESRYRRHFYFGIADGNKADFMHLRACEALYKARGGGKPSTIYDVIGAAQVAKASFAGMRLLHHVGQRHAIWPFDPLPSAGPVIVEIYTQIAARASGMRKGLSKIRDGATLDLALATFGSRPHAPLDRYTDHATDALLTAAWLRAHAGQAALWAPALLTPEVAATEGWTFGIA
jgi:hypothetical protein